MAEQQEVHQRNEWGPGPPGRHVGGTKVRNGGYSRLLRQHGGLSNLQGGGDRPAAEVAGVGLVENGLPVGADQIQPVEGDPGGSAHVLDRFRVEASQQDPQVADEAGRNRLAGSDPQERPADLFRIGIRSEMLQLNRAVLLRPDNPHQGGIHSVQRGSRHEADHQLGYFHGAAA